VPALSPAQLDQRRAAWADVARRIVAAFPAKRLARQVDPSGALPKELTRTRSFHYSLYALDAAYTLADSAACLGIDLYGAQEKGRSLRKATDYVAAYRGRAADWPHKEQEWPTDMLDRLLVPEAQSRASSNPVRSPRVTESSAAPVPTMPPSSPRPAR